MVAVMVLRKEFVLENARMAGMGDSKYQLWRMDDHHTTLTDSLASWSSTIITSWTSSNGSWYFRSDLIYFSQCVELPYK